MADYFEEERYLTLLNKFEKESLLKNKRKNEMLIKKKKKWKKAMKSNVDEFLE